MKRKNLFKLMSFILTLAVLCGCSEKTPETTSSSNEDQSDTEISTSEDISSSSESDNKTEYEFVKAPEGFSKSIIYSYDDYYITNRDVAMPSDSLSAFVIKQSTYKEFLDENDAVLLKVCVGGENIDAFACASNGLAFFQTSDGRPVTGLRPIAYTIIPCYIEEVLYGGEDFSKEKGNLIYISLGYQILDNNNLENFLINSSYDYENTVLDDPESGYSHRIVRMVKEGKNVIYSSIYPMIYGNSYLIAIPKEPFKPKRVASLANGMPDFYYECMLAPYDPVSMGTDPTGEEFTDHSEYFQNPTLRGHKRVFSQLLNDYGYLFGIETNAVTSSEQ